MAAMAAPKGHPRYGGRPKGGRNRVTNVFRETVAQLLADNADNFAEWLRLVAEGDPSVGRQPDPARALDLLSKLAEYAAPKLGRIEHTEGDGGPLRGVTTIEIEFVTAPPRAAPASDLVKQFPASSLRN